jgi:hypothetical protein
MLLAELAEAYPVEVFGGFHAFIIVPAERWLQEFSPDGKKDEDISSGVL